MNVDQLLPQVQKLISEKTIQLLSSEGPKVAIRGLYTILPSPIRWVVKEETFLEFCLTHQEKLFGKTAIPNKKAASKKLAAKKVKSTPKKALATKKKK